MSNIIPPLVSSSPPPMVAGEPDDLNDEFGDFEAAVDLSFEGYSLPSTPQHASYSNFTSISTQHNTFQTTNVIISSKSENHVLSEIYNGESKDNFKEEKIFSAENISENIFCDIKTDVNTTFVNNNDNKTDENDIKLSLETTTKIEDSSVTFSEETPEVVEYKFDRRKGDISNEIKLDYFNNFSKNTLELDNNDFGDFNCFSSTVNNKSKFNSKNGDFESVKCDLLSNLNAKSENNLNEIKEIINENGINEDELSIITSDNHCNEGKLENYEERNVMTEEHSSGIEISTNNENFKILNEKQPNDFCCKEINTSESCPVENLEFGDFGSSKTSNLNEDEDFGDFNSTSINNENCTKEDKEIILESTEGIDKSENSDADDFGDFNEFPVNFEVSSFKSLADAEKIINDVFNVEETSKSDSQFVDFMANIIFKQVEDIENTNALTYQWTNSESQKTLLKALNIDSRNILYGPRWNASMPKFAANLGFTPLEPVKTDISNISGVQTVTADSSEQQICEVPAAKFDWTSSGLVNPLDYSQANTMLLDLEQLVPSLDIPHISLSQSEQSPENELPLNLDSWDCWLQTQLPDSMKPESVEDKLNQSSECKLHASESTSAVQLDLNILNNFGSDNESVNSLKFIEASTEIENEVKSESDKCSDKVSLKETTDEDFSSFQSSESLSSTKLPKESHAFNTENNTEQQKNPVLNIQQFDLGSTIVTPELSRKNINVQSVDNDDFADFQMSLPEKQTNTNEFAGNIPLEPLKPIVLETSVISTAPAQINWPEPGIVTDDISDFEFTYSVSSKEQNQIVEQEIPIKKEESVKKCSSVEEDDWSDFVCAQESSKNLKVTDIKAALKPLNKTSQNMSNLSSSSQLELSVPNLQNAHLKHKTILPPNFIPNSSPIKTVNNQPSTQQLAAQQVRFGYQPPYQIPLQTINTPFGGLPQTSLSTYNNFTIGPTELSTQAGDKKANVNFGLFDGPFNPQIKPFQTNNPSVNINKSNFESSLNCQVQSVENTFMKMQQPSVSTAWNTSISTVKIQDNDDDDDDWSDFVSSQPVSAANLNGFGNLQKGTVISNWNEKAPNIIANPGHFESFQSYQSSSNTDNKTINSNKTGKGSIPSISALPELDFIAPKNKLFSKK